MTSKPAKPELTHPTNWMPIVELYRLLLAQTGNPRLAVLDLDEAVASGRITCMRRWMKDGSRELVPTSLWERHAFTVWGNSGCFVEMGFRGDVSVPVLDSVLYLWRPDAQRLWPHLFKDEQQPRQPPVGSRLFTAKQIEGGQAFYGRLLDDDPLRWRVQATAAEYVTTVYFGLGKESIQTVEDAIIIPVLVKRGLREPPRK
jgi:hypothetical protein